MWPTHGTACVGQDYKPYDLCVVCPGRDGKSNTNHVFGAHQQGVASWEVSCDGAAERERC